MLEVDGLRYAYGKAIAVRDVSFAIEEGSIVTLVGSNGAGKTTIIKNVAGFLTPDSGTITYQGEVINGMPANQLAKRGISLVPEREGRFPDMTVEENLELGLGLLDDETARNDQLDYLYDLFPRLAERRNQIAQSMSGGEQKMLDLARGLAGDPKLLILDEPSLGLMPTLVEEVFELIELINQEGVDVLLVEQNVHEALSLCDHGYILENGRTTIDGTGEELLADEYIRDRFLGAVVDD